MTGKRKLRLYSRIYFALFMAVCLSIACGCGERSAAQGQGDGADGIWEEIEGGSAGGSVESGSASDGKEPSSGGEQGETGTVGTGPDTVHADGTGSDAGFADGSETAPGFADGVGGSDPGKNSAGDTGSDAGFADGSGEKDSAGNAAEDGTGKDSDVRNGEKTVNEVTLADGTRLSDDASGFVLLSEAVPDALQEIRYYSTYNFVGDRIDGYEEPSALLTKEAASALKAVSDDVMAQGYRLKIYDAYRPQQAVDHFVRWAQDPYDMRMKQDFYPELDKSVLFRKGYIARRSGHSRGSTVDLTLVDNSTGLDVDMGGTFDHFGNLSHPDYAGITPEQSANRNFLRNAMTARGFKPISTEWWHFTLANEPYPGTYFTFPVSSSSVAH